MTISPRDVLHSVYSTCGYTYPYRGHTGDINEFEYIYLGSNKNIEFLVGNLKAF